MGKVKISIADLERHLKEQIVFLQRSVKAFDQGYLDEAKRISVVIRVLVHDTATSKSLLEQLNLKKIKFLDTCPDYSKNTIIIGPFTGLVWKQFSIKGVKFVPKCSVPVKPSEPYTWKEFNEWWEKIVIEDSKGQKFSRRKLILVLANKEGGAHIDPELDADYAALSRDNSMGCFYEVADNIGPITAGPMTDIELVSCRQIAKEILESLKNVRPYLF